MDNQIHQYLSRIGQVGGKKSRRTLSSETAKQMVQVREARRMFKKYHSQCFWSYDPKYIITLKDVPWVAKQLMKNGNATLWKLGAKLCH
ncbi:MAG: hypothetical protein ISR65_07990 [Bacteriovoracaceae bacterium]|nr:hypothetical protein [Bacteriovoracaceae bacterium]